MTVFILGAGVMQIPALQIAKELGWTLAAADGNPAAPGASLVDRFFPVDLKDRDGLLETAMKLRAEGGLEAVFTAGTDFSAQVSFLAERLGLPSHSYESASAASDKLKMRAAFAAANLPSPRFVALTLDTDPIRAVGRLGFPLVVKPADNMGARGCRLAGSEPELLEAVAAALPQSRSGRVIVEEYVEGPEFSIDAIVVDGEIRIRGIADRHIFFEPYFVELGHTMPSSAPAAIQAEVLRVFCAGIRALGLHHGAAKGDMKWSPARGGAFIGEIAARLSGGYMSGWTYPYASGIEPTREALLLAAGLEPGTSPTDRGWCSAERAFLSIPGRVESILGLRTAQNLPYVKNLFLRAEPGDELRFPSNNVEKCGNVISQAPDRERAVAAAEDAIRELCIRLRPNTPATEDFLKGKGSIRSVGGTIWPPRAFDLPPELSAIVDALPERLPGMRGGGDLVVAPLPEVESPSCRDWSGRSFADSALLAMRIAGARFAESRTKGALAGRFWRALERGGAQAALYVLDSEERGGAGA